MAGRVFFAIFFLIAVPSYAPIRYDECGFEIALNQGIERDARPSRNFSDPPYPLEDLSGAFDSHQMHGLRHTLAKLGLDLEPGREYLNDKESALRAYDQWKLDFDEAMRDPELKKEAEAFLLAYLQNPPIGGSNADTRFHPGLSEEGLLPRHKTLDDYYSDRDCIKPLDTIAGTFENYLEFRAVLEADTYSDPRRRSKAITQMRAGYLISSLMRARRPKVGKYLDLGR